MTEATEMKKLMAGKNECGENVLYGEDDVKRITKTLQDNGWTRILIEYTDGFVEETYER